MVLENQVDLLQGFLGQRGSEHQCNLALDSSVRVKGASTLPLARF